MENGKVWGEMKGGIEGERKRGRRWTARSLPVEEQKDGAEDKQRKDESEEKIHDVKEQARNIHHNDGSRVCCFNVRVQETKKTVIM